MHHSTVVVQSARTFASHCTHLDSLSSAPLLDDKNGALGGGNDWGPKNPPVPPLSCLCLFPPLPNRRKCEGSEPTLKSPKESWES
eukprot:scaffold640_cov180-Alexandrium_tamarense.AAC.2